MGGKTIKLSVRREGVKTDNSLRPQAYVVHASACPSPSPHFPARSLSEKPNADHAGPRNPRTARKNAIDRKGMGNFISTVSAAFFRRERLFSQILGFTKDPTFKLPSVIRLAFWVTSCHPRKPNHAVVPANFKT